MEYFHVPSKDSTYISRQHLDSIRYEREKSEVVHAEEGLIYSSAAKIFYSSIIAA